MMTALVLLALQARCVPDCPTSLTHAASLDHTHGKACGCEAKIDVCFALCRTCAGKKGLCDGCGAKPLAPLKHWKSPDPTEAGIRLIEGDVVAIARGQVLESERARLAGLREFKDRLEVTIVCRSALCGSEPLVFDALYVRVPTGKPIVVRQIRRDLFGGHKVSVLAELK
jgi:hypothetical protein